MVRAMVLTEHVSELPGGLVKPESLGSTPRISDSGGLERDLRICTSNKFPSDVAGLKTTF